MMSPREESKWPIEKAIEELKNGDREHPVKLESWKAWRLSEFLEELLERRKDRPVDKDTTYVVTVTYLHDMDTEYRKVYQGKDPVAAKQAFQKYLELWYDGDEKIVNPFAYKESCGYFKGAKYKDDYITYAQAEEMLSDALDDAIANDKDYYIDPEDVGQELDFSVCPCRLEVFKGEYFEY